MRANYNIKPTISTQKGSVKKNFVLLPENKVAPLIAVQPANGLEQTTYIGIDNKLKPLIAVNGKASILKNTNISIKVKTTDPSNIVDSTSSTNLKFVWTFNGSELTQYNQLNNGKGVNQITLKDTTPLHNGEYQVQVSNNYGAVLSEPLTLEVIDIANNEFFHNNLIQNSIGNAGLSNWTVDQDITVSQFDSSYEGVLGFASILNGGKVDPIWDINANFDKPKPRFLGELPFKFSTTPNKTNFNKVWSEINLGVKSFTFDSMRNYPANIIGNEAPNKQYSQFFPSPYAIDAYNKNDKGKRGLVVDLRKTPTYFTRNKMQFNTSQTSTLTQTIDLSNISNTVDGNTPGVDKIIAQFFCYLGAGVSRYLYELLNEKGEVVKVLNTYIVSPIMWGRFLANDPGFVKTDIPDNVVRINLVPVLEDTSTVQVKCLDSNGNVLNNTTIESPTLEDIWAVKEKMFISSYINKLFNLTTNFNNRIPVYINNKKYFNIELDGGDRTVTNENRKWLKSYYPKYRQILQGPNRKYTLETWEDGNFTMKGFDKGAAALFGYNKTFQIPIKTRSVQVVVSFTNTTQARYDQNPKSYVSGYRWIYEDLYATHLAGKGIYQYNHPKTAATLFKLVLDINGLENRNVGTYNYPTYFIPEKNVWYDSKRALQENTMDETLGYTTYMSFDGPYNVTVDESDVVSTTNALNFDNLESGTIQSGITVSQVPPNTTSQGTPIAQVTASLNNQIGTKIVSSQATGSVTQIKQTKLV